MTVTTENMKKCSICSSQDLVRVHVYDVPPHGETCFDPGGMDSYHREIWQCRFCGYFVNRFQMTMADIYNGTYMSATYGRENLEDSYRRIMALPSGLSDNYQRTMRINSYLTPLIKKREAHSKEKPSVLDVGSGLCVFPAKMKEFGWSSTALDPDKRAVAHARDHVGINAFHGDFLHIDGIGLYDLITFNKVLEHVSNPVDMLTRSRQFLRKDGYIYVEVPDGVMARKDGWHREEFFIEHLSIFSNMSLSLLAGMAGFEIELIEQVQEPSSKYTLRAFLVVQ